MAYNKVVITEKEGPVLVEKFTSKQVFLCQQGKAILIDLSKRSRYNYHKDSWDAIPGDGNILSFKYSTSTLRYLNSVPKVSLNDYEIIDTESLNLMEDDGWYKLQEEE